MFWPRLYLSDERIKKNIENAFFWSPFVHSNEIKVSVTEGMATLTGTVETWNRGGVKLTRTPAGVVRPEW